MNSFIKSFDNWSHLIFLFTLFFLCFASGCTCNSDSDDDDDSVEEPDEDADDDLNDDVDDDSALPDDDTDDDVDDDADDDSGDDDTEDHFADDDTEDPSIPVYDKDGLYIEMVAGGLPGHRGQDLVVTDAGDIYVLAAKGRTLFLYHADENLTLLDKEILAQFAATPSIGKDSAGNLYVLYHNMREEKLVLLTQRGRSWTSENVMDYMCMGSGFDYIPMAVEPATGAVHIAAWDHANMAMQYLSNSSGEWTRVTVDSALESPDMINPKSISVDNDHYVHIAYFFVDNYTTYMYYATNQSGQWEIDSVIEENRAIDLDMDVDEDGKPFIVWTNLEEADNLRFAKHESNAWTTGTFGEQDWWGCYVEVDYFGSLFHIIGGDCQDTYDLIQYWTFSNDGLTKVSEEIIEPNNDDIKMGVGSGGRVYFTHYYSQYGEFGLSLLENDALQTEVFDTGMNVGFLPSLSLDQDNVPYIAFSETPDSYNNIEKDFFVARRVDDRWEFRNMGYGWSGAVSAGPDGAVHVAWWRNQDYKLLYAKYSDGRWSAEEEVPYPYDEESDQVRYNVISAAQDSQGSPCLLFTGEGSDLCYSKKENEEWTTETLSIGYYEDNEVRLIIDGNDNPMASYTAYYWFFMYDFHYLRYFEYDGGQWTQTILQGFTMDEHIGEGHDFHYDGQTKYMSYEWYYGNEHLTFARNDGADWEYEEVNDADTFGTGISTDSAGNVYIAYLVEEYNGTSSSGTKVRIVTKRNDEWIEKTIDSGGQFYDLGIRFEIDSDDRAHVLYRGEYALWYATFPVEWMLN